MGGDPACEFCNRKWPYLLHIHCASAYFPTFESRMILHSLTVGLSVPHEATFGVQAAKASYASPEIDVIAPQKRTENRVHRLWTKSHPEVLNMFKARDVF